MIVRGGGIVGLALILAACSSAERSGSGWLTGKAYDIDAVAALPLNTDPYLGALQEGYLKAAKAEIGQFNWDHGATFLERARRAAAGDRVAPFSSKDYTFRADADELSAAELEINAYVASEGSMLRAAHQIGEAQVFFDCWVQESSENYADKDIETCRDSYALMIILVRDLAALPDNMAVVLPEKGEIGGIELAQGAKKVTLDKAFAAAGTGEKLGDVPVEEGEIRDAFAGALGAQPPPPKEFELTFPFNGTRITDEAFEVILQAVAEARARAGAEVLVTGHADAVGDLATNLAISRSRAERVKVAMQNELRDREEIDFSSSAKGEKKLKEDTRQQSELNRRVVILVR